MASLRVRTVASLRTLDPGVSPRSAPVRCASTFQSRAAPPRLPADQQDEFERLQQSALEIPTEPPAASQNADSTTGTQAAAAAETRVDNPTFRRGSPPEFDGDKHPTTGEVGGPKNEPLRWGSEGDWSYNGRVTDF